MISQNIWIGITTGVFIAGLVIGYSAFDSSMNSGNMMVNSQQVMMQDPQFRKQMMESLTQDQDTMQAWMQNPQHVEQMTRLMKDNHDFAMDMMTAMIDDPGLRLQMIGHMTDNHESMQQMKNMMGANMMMSDMEGGMMSSGIQEMNKEAMMYMMQDPETREKIIQAMTKHVDEMQNILSSKLTEDEFNTQMTELMYFHKTEMQSLMSSQNMHHSGKK